MPFPSISAGQSLKAVRCDAPDWQLGKRSPWIPAHGNLDGSCWQHSALGTKGMEGGKAQMYFYILSAYGPKTSRNTFNYQLRTLRRKILGRKKKTNLCTQQYYSTLTFHLIFFCFNWRWKRCGLESQKVICWNPLKGDVGFWCAFLNSVTLYKEIEKFSLQNNFTKVFFFFVGGRGHGNLMGNIPIRHSYCFAKTILLMLLHISLGLNNEK